MLEVWERISCKSYNSKIKDWEHSIAYKLKLDDWFILAGRLEPKFIGKRYKYEVYEEGRPQSAVALEVEVDEGGLIDVLPSYTGALSDVKSSFINLQVWSYPGIPNPLRNNLIRALTIA
jgi:hypothetical protein